MSGESTFYCAKCSKEREGFDYNDFCLDCRYKTMKNVHIALDFDKTLAYYKSGSVIESVGAPILPMLEKVHEWLSKGYNITIFSARFSYVGEKLEKQQKLVTNFLKENGLPNLPKTAVKYPKFTHFIDDKGYHVEPNMGIISNTLHL